MTPWCWECIWSLIHEARELRKCVASELWGILEQERGPQSLSHLRGNQHLQCRPSKKERQDLRESYEQNPGGRWWLLIKNVCCPKRNDTIQDGTEASSPYHRSLALYACQDIRREKGEIKLSPGSFRPHVVTHSAYLLFVVMSFRPFGCWQTWCPSLGTFQTLAFWLVVAQNINSICQTLDS